MLRSIFGGAHMRNVTSSSSFWAWPRVSLLAGCPDRTISEVTPRARSRRVQRHPGHREPERRHLVRHRRLAVDGRQADQPRRELPELHQRPQHDPGRSARRAHRRRDARTLAPRARRMRTARDWFSSARAAAPAPARTATSRRAAPPVTGTFISDIKHADGTRATQLHRRLADGVQPDGAASAPAAAASSSTSRR